jgi:hypothetical protein
MLIGVTAALASWESWRILSRVLQPTVVELPYLLALPRLPLGALPAFIVAWLVAAVTFSAGWKPRIGGGALTVAAAYTLLMDQQTYSNHLYLLGLSLFLLTVADSGAAWSLDALLRVARDSVPAWPVRLLKIQASLVYGFSALAKVTGPYLAGDVLARNLKMEGLLGVPLAWRVPVVMSGLAVLSIVVEVFIAVGLWSPRLRAVAMALGVGFHLLVIGLLGSSRLALGIFALDMFAIYVLFVDADRWFAPSRAAGGSA